MKIVGGIFPDETDMNAALDALHEAGFEVHKLYGTDDFSGEPHFDEQTHAGTRQHTAAGTISGISDPPAEVPEQPSTETIEDELMALGLSQPDARSFLDPLRDDRLLLLVPTETGKAGNVEQILKQHNASHIRGVQPEDAFPEDLWRPAR